LGLPADDVVALVERRDQHGVEVDGPDAGVGFLEADVLVGARLPTLPSRLPPALESIRLDPLRLTGSWLGYLFEAKDLLDS
jgi:hypothetical protein